MAPYVRTNEDNEQSAHAMLLLYIPWPKEGEVNLFRGESSATLAFGKLKAANELPLHVLTQIEAFKTSDAILNDIGEVPYGEDDDRMEDNEAIAEAVAENSDADSNSETGSNATYEDEDNGGLATTTTDTTPMEVLTNSTTTGTTSCVGAEVITERQSLYYRAFVDNAIATFMNNLMRENCTTNVHLAESVGTNDHTNGTSNSNSDNNNNTTTTTTTTTNTSSGGKVPVNNEQEREIELRKREDRMTPDQRKAYDELLEYILGKRQNVSKTVIQFISGGAGVGKSEYIKCLIERVPLHYGKQPGLYGSVIIMGPTGSSAHHIGGFTWQSLLGKAYEATTLNQNQFMSQERAEEIYKRIKGVKLIIIDEVSMVGLEALHEISRRVCEAICTSIADRTERMRVNNKPFAGITTILCGDLYQLGCIKATPIYATGDLNTAATAGRKIWRSITMFHDFRTSTRFAQKKHNTKSILETFLNGARIGAPNPQHLSTINTQICINYEDAYRKCNKRAVWLASTHKEVDEINRFMYNKLKASGALCMDILAKHTRNNCPNDHMTKAEREKYYSKKIDKAPVLIRLAIGSRVKITDNIGSPIGTYII